MYTTKSQLPTWSITKKITVGVIVGGCLGLNPIKNIYGAEYYLKKMSLKSDNKIVTLPLDLHEVADNVRKEVRLKPKTREKIKFFCSKGLDFTSIGNTNLIGDTRIGIPFVYKYKKVEDVDPNVVGSIIGYEKLQQKDWDQTENGKKLIASLVLSEETFKFAIAREIVGADSEMVFYKDIVSFTCSLIALSAFEILQPRTASFIGKWPSIILLGSMLAISSISIAMISIEYFSHLCAEMDDIRTLKYTKSNYREGASEYFEKLIERNQSLRGLLIDGPERFDADGNPISWYKMNFSSIKERLDKCKKSIETIKDEPITI